MNNPTLSLIFSRFKSFIFSALVFSCAGSANAALTTVNCAGSGDRATIQAAIDAASPGDTISLQGTCYLDDGQQVFINKSHLTITGDPINWNTVVKGLLTLSGTPVRESSLADNYINRGFVIGSSDPSFTDIIQDVVIKNIKFTDFNRGISVSADFVGESSKCSDITITTGRAKNITIEHNWFDNVVRGIQAVGASSNVLIRNNQLSNVLGIGIMGIGEQLICIRDPNLFAVGVGDVKNIKVMNNVIDASNGLAGMLFMVLTGVISDNETTGGLGGILVDGGGPANPLYALNVNVLNNNTHDATDFGCVFRSE